MQLWEASLQRKDNKRDDVKRQVRGTIQKPRGLQGEQGIKAGEARADANAYTHTLPHHADTHKHEHAMHTGADMHMHAHAHTGQA